MQAAVFHGQRDVRLTELDVPEPRAGEVLVRVQRAGICGSDLNMFHHGLPNREPGFVMGHEFCGEIAGLGASVTAWHVGQQIVVEPTIYCGTCHYCQLGMFHRCIYFAERGLTGAGAHGGFAEYVCVPAYQPHDRPSEVTPTLGALVEPTAVGVHGWNLDGIAEPDSVVVVGIGNIGLLAILVAKAKGVENIIAIGKYAPRQALAKAYGASVVIEPDDPTLAQQILDHTKGLGAELVLEAAGAPSSLRMAVDAARKGAKIVVLGVFYEEVALDYRSILVMEKQIMGSIIYSREDFAQAIAILAQSDVDLEHHITAEIPLQAIITQGFGALSESKSTHVKIHIDPQS